MAGSSWHGENFLRNHLGVILQWTDRCGARGLREEGPQDGEQILWRIWLIWFGAYWVEEPVENFSVEYLLDTYVESDRHWL